MNFVTNTKTMRYLNLFYIILILWCLSGTEVVARKGECADSCDESMDDCDEDDYEDSLSQSDDSGADPDYLLSRIDELENEVLPMFQAKANLTSALIDCLIKSKRHMSKSRESKRRGLDLSHLTSGDCDSDYYEDDSTAESYNGKCTRRLNDKIRGLERSKDTLEGEIKRLQTRLDECNVTLPKPKIKKFIIRFEKVSWYEAVRLCMNEQKQIATIISQDEDDAFNQARTDQDIRDGEIWIGKRQNTTSGLTSWKGQNLTASDYMNWYHAQLGNRIDDYDANCVVSSYYDMERYLVYRCSTKYNYACEYY